MILLITNHRQNLLVFAYLWTSSISRNRGRISSQGNEELFSTLIHPNCLILNTRCVFILVLHL